jgi:hypothetical protein
MAQCGLVGRGPVRQGRVRLGSARRGLDLQLYSRQGWSRLVTVRPVRVWLGAARQGMARPGLDTPTNSIQAGASPARWIAAWSGKVGLGGVRPFAVGLGMAWWGGVKRCKAWNRNCTRGEALLGQVRLGRVWFWPGMVVPGVAWCILVKPYPVLLLPHVAWLRLGLTWQGMAWDRRSNAPVFLW